MESGMGQERWKQLAAWSFYGCILLLICVLSFQNGDAARALDGPVKEQLMGQEREDISEEMVERIIYYVRQTGRAILFFLLGAGQGLAIWLTFREPTGRKRIFWSMAVLLMISYVTEKAKIFIDGRHYVFTEFLESFLFCVLGYLLSVVFLRRWQRRRGK